MQRRDTTPGDLSPDCIYWTASPTSELQTSILLTIRSGADTTSRLLPDGNT